MKFNTEYIDHHAVIHIEGSISNENLSELEEEIKSIVKQDLHVILDLSEVVFICSYGVAMLFKFTTDAKERNKKFIIANVREDIYKLFVATNIDRHLVILDTVAEALALQI